MQRLLKVIGKVLQKCRQKGNGSILFAVATIFPIMGLILLLAARLQTYDLGISAQNRADAFAIMEAESGKTATGINPLRMISTWGKIQGLDGESDGKQYGRFLTVFDLSTFTTISHDYIPVSALAQTKSILTGDIIQQTRKAVSRVILVYKEDIDYDAFPLPQGDFIPDITPLVTSTTRNRSRNKYLEVIDQFKLGGNNQRYMQITDTSIRQMVLLRDFTLAMGCGLPTQINGKMYSTEVFANTMEKSAVQIGWYPVSQKQAIAEVNAGHPTFAISSDKQYIIILMPDASEENSTRIMCAYANGYGMSTNAPLPANSYTYYSHP